jgi:PAS domain S-box-containing protein
MAVEKFPDEISIIRALLAENPEGLTIKSISEMLGMNRNSAANTLHLLQMQGRVTLKRVGAAKIYCLANKLPVDAVMKLSNNGVIVFSKGEVVVDINEPFRELLQLSKRELIGKTTGQLPFLVESHPGLPRLIRDALKGKENRISADLVLADRSVPCMLTLCPVFFESGDSGVALIADISAGAGYPLRTDNGTDESLDDLDVIEYICRFTADGTLTYINQAYCDLVQKGKTELLGHKWRPAVPESEYKKIKKCLLSLDSLMPVASLEIKTITPGGDTHWQRWKFRNLLKRDGQSTGYQGTGIEITGIKNLEENIRKGAEEQERLVREHKAELQDLNKQIYNEISSHEKTHFQLQFTQFAMDNASYLITWVSREGRFVYMNRKAQQVLGYQYRDVMTKKFQDIIAGIFSFPWDEIWEAILHDQQYTLETALRASDGTEIPVEMVLNYLEFRGKQYCCCFAKDITERKMVEEALKTSEAQYRSIVETSQEGILYRDETDHIIYVNETMASLLGYTPDEMMGKMLVEFITADERESHTQMMSLRRTGKTGTYERSYMHRNGTVRIMNVSASPVFDSEGAFSGSFGMFTDITERRNAETALKMHSEIVQNMAEGVVLVRVTDGVIVFANPRFESMFGYSPGELEGSHISMITAPDVKSSQDIADEIITRLKQTGVWSGDVLSIRKDGTTFWCNATVSTFKHPQYGQVWVGVQMDITGRKRAEDALKESETKYRTLVENIPEKIFVKDASEAYVSCNEHYARDLGIVAGAIVGKTDYDFYPRDLAEKYQADDREIMESGANRTIEERYIVNGRETWVSTVKTPIRDKAGNISGILGIFHDITRRKQVEERLREKSRQELKLTSDSLQKTEADLHLHQTELEMQNEELRQSHANLEQSRERYFELYDLAPAGYITISKHGLVLNANFTAATLFGVERQNLVNMPLSRFIVQDDQAVFYACRNELIETGTRQSCELCMLYSDGSTFRVQVIAVQAPASEGDDAAISLMLIDITGRKQTDEVLQKREKIFGVMFESHDSVMLLIDPGTGTIIDANQAAERFYGRSRENLSTLSIDEINTLPPEEVKALLAKVAQGQITSFTAQHRRSSGEIRTVEVHSSPIALAGKTVLFSIIHDITDRKAGGGDVI